MNILEVTDLDLLKAFHEVECAAFDHDFVALPYDPIDELVPIVEGHQPTGEIKTMWVAYDGATPVGAATLTLWTLDNLESSNLEVRIHPDHRRRGHGRELLTHSLTAARTAGRARVFIEAPWTPAGEEGPAFPLLRSIGARPVLDDVRRLLDLQSALVPDPHPVPADYELVQWVDTAPEHLLDGLAYLLHRMVLDAPMGEMDFEPEAWDAARYRDSELDCRRQQRTRVTTVVVHAPTGQVAGMTEVGINAHHHDVAYQWNTIVDPSHRGKRLGMVIKSANHRYLFEQVEGIRYINTWNAESNAFMISVNEELGFHPAERWTEWQLEL